MLKCVGNDNYIKWHALYTFVKSAAVCYKQIYIRDALIIMIEIDVLHRWKWNFYKFNDVWEQIYNRNVPQTLFN